MSIDIGTWVSGFCFGTLFALYLRFALDRYVERFKKAHHQWPYDEER